MSVTRASLIARLRNPAKTTVPQNTVLLTGAVCDDMREAATEIERLRAQLYDDKLLRMVIDETWGEACEDGSVPSTKLQDKILTRVYVAHQQNVTEPK